MSKQAREQLAGKPMVIKDKVKGTYTGIRAHFEQARLLSWAFVHIFYFVLKCFKKVSVLVRFGRRWYCGLGSKDVHRGIWRLDLQLVRGPRWCSPSRAT